MEIAEIDREENGCIKGTNAKHPDKFTSLRITLKHSIGR